MSVISQKVEHFMYGFDGDGVETRLGFAVQIRSAIKCRGQPHKTREGSLESGRMGNTSPATEPP